MTHSNEFFSKILPHFPELSSVVNNAGVVEAHGFEWGPNLDVYEQMLKVNFIGQIRVTRHFCPLLRRNPGSRLVFVSSCAGL